MVNPHRVDGLEDKLLLMPRLVRSEMRPCGVDGVKGGDKVGAAHGAASPLFAGVGKMVFNSRHTMRQPQHFGHFSSMPDSRPNPLHASQQAGPIMTPQCLHVGWRGRGHSFGA
jgi:hypothetical protein